MGDDFFNNDEMQSLFHLLGKEEKITISKREIAQSCEQLMLNFQKLTSNIDCKSIFETYCQQYYKQGFLQILEDFEINLEEMPNFQTNQEVWIEFVKITNILVKNNEDKLLLLEPDGVKELLNATKTLDLAWNLKLHLNK